MKKDVFEKAKKLNNSIINVKAKKESIELFKKKRNNNSEPPIIFGFQSTNFIRLSDEDVEYFANYLIEKCDSKIKQLEEEFDRL